MRVALAHDWLVGYRGGEAVLDRIACCVREEQHTIVALYTMFNDGRPLAGEVDYLPKVVSPLNRIPGGAGALRRWLFPLYPWAVRRLSGRLAREPDVKLLISTSSSAIKGMRAPRGAKHICYCHSPARYVWAAGDEYGKQRGEGVKGFMRSAGLGAFSKAFKEWDRRTAQTPENGGCVDTFLANSTHTAGLIRDCYGRESEVLFPPVRTDFFDRPLDPRGTIYRGSPPAPEEDDGEALVQKSRLYWLAVGALEPYKRFDLAILAAARAGVRLLIAGRGTQRGALERVAADAKADATFLGRVGDRVLHTLYSNARLLVFPQIEDFGITAVEAQAAGTPVVARRAGGALDTVVDGVTGAFFDAATPEAIVAAAERCPLGGDHCRRNAERFSETQFESRFRALLMNA